MKTTVDYSIHLEIEVEDFGEGWGDLDDVVSLVVDHSTAREAIGSGLDGSRRIVASVTGFHIESRRIGMRCRKDDGA